jgi:c-di-GMP-binding flagellar brake protein YcgR
MRPNQRVTFEVMDGEPGNRYVSRIEGVASDHLLLAAPFANGAPVLLRAGTPLRVTLFHAGGAHAFETAILARVPGTTPAYQVNRPERLLAIQRRQFFREPAVVETFCSKSADHPVRIEGLTRNIGGGGILLRTQQIKVLKELVADRRTDEPFWIELSLPDRPLHALADLAWLNIEEDHGAADLALEFLDLPDAERERLIRYLFVLQREALKKGF